MPTGYILETIRENISPVEGNRIESIKAEERQIQIGASVSYQVEDQVCC